MTARILDGKIIRDGIVERLKQRLSGCATAPKLAIVQVGRRPESDAYIRQKMLFGEKIGCSVDLYGFPEEISEAGLAGEVRKLSANPSIHGVIVQLPLPDHIDPFPVIEAITSEKDVDGLGATNLKLLSQGKRGHVPATAKGVMTLLNFYGIPLEGKRAVVVGRSSLVGKPVALSLLNLNATVTICHRKTEDLSSITKQADVLVVAAGSVKLIGKEHVSDGQAVIDVGMTMHEENGTRSFAGDVDFDAVQGIVGALTPVPGGVGPMTVASLFENLFDGYDVQRENAG